MFNRFTDRARRVAELALEEAQAFDHEHADPEHVLLGIGTEGQGVGAAVLDSMGISLVSVRHEVEAIIGRGDGRIAHPVRFSDRANVVFDLSEAETAFLEHEMTGTEHLLLGLIRESGPAAQILAGHGVTLERTRTEILTFVGRFSHGKLPEVGRLKTSAEIDLETRISEIRAAKAAAINASDYDVAGRLREKEKDLLGELATLRQSMTP